MSYTQTAAIARAEKLLGTSYPPGWCQAFVVTKVFNTGGVGDFDGDKAADAEDGWKKAVKYGTVVKAPTGGADLTQFIASMPAGFMAYWGGGSHDNGHAAVTAGKGMIYSTDLPTRGKIGKVKATDPHTKWGLTFLGYATKDGNGHDLRDPIAVTGKTTFEDKTLVVTASELNLRKSPVNGTVVGSLKKGQLFKSTGHATANKVEWYTDGKAWASGAYLANPADVPPKPKSADYVVVAGNVYSSDYHPWDAKRINDMTQTLVGQAYGGRASVNLLSEINNNHDHDTITKILGKTFTEAAWYKNQSNNHHYLDPTKFKITGRLEKSLGTTTKPDQKRCVTLTTGIHIESGLPVCHAAAHLSSATHGATANEAALSRKVEAKNLARIVHGTPLPGWDVKKMILYVDGNSATWSTGNVRDILAKSGLHAMQRLAGVVNAQYDSHHDLNKAPAKDESWIDEVWYGDDVTIEYARQIVPFWGASDHVIRVLKVSVAA